MRLVWTLPARRDRRTIFDHIRQDNPGAAADMDDVFAKASQQLSHFPDQADRGVPPAQDNCSSIQATSSFMI
ncbi:type II toxin-antitoxin system RelE/ParE family toxin [Aliirhizobium terrae]|nr:type II toxin-antitoxin system RelE/ParE family toxin [Rhizobium sp. CC-CFT758]WJH41835.1 type II toxin-antitoxin system RelE/ParE family toxin [Rhizobium sp. CC-CFT758]